MRWGLPGTADPQASTGSSLHTSTAAVALDVGTTLLASQTFRQVKAHAWATQKVRGSKECKSRIPDVTDLLSWLFLAQISL